MDLRLLTEKRLVSQERPAEICGLSLRTIQRLEAGHRDSHASLRALASLVSLLASSGLPAAADVGSAQADSNMQQQQQSPIDPPRWLWGEWSRDWILRGNSRSGAVEVHYLQTPTYFADIRIAKDRGAVSTAKSFSDLSDDQLFVLARQNGFTGRTTLVGDVATWSDEVAFQPSDGSPDTGRLVRMAPDRMREVGLDGSYTESWRHLPGAQGPFLVIREEHAGRLVRTLIVVGNRFLYVRNRDKDLPVATSLEALIAATKATREETVALLDCEFSAGRVLGGAVPWEIRQSTLPWRETHHLNFVDEITTNAGRPAPRVAGTNQWSVPVNTFSEGEIQALFAR